MGLNRFSEIAGRLMLFIDEEDNKHWQTADLLVFLNELIDLGAALKLAEEISVSTDAENEVSAAANPTIAGKQSLVLLIDDVSRCCRWSRMRLRPSDVW